MSRNMILQVAAILVIATIMGILAVASSPVWLTALMVKPDLLSPVYERATQTFTRMAIRQAMRGNK